MARLWVAYREGLELLGRVIAEVPLESSISRLDLAPWRFFSPSPPREVSREELAEARLKKRILVEVRPPDAGSLSGYAPGVYDSPLSPEEGRRRLGLPADS